MIITSVRFRLFCLGSVMLFLIFPRKQRWMALLFSSVAFYFVSLSDKRIIARIALTSLTTWLSAGIIEKLAASGRKALPERGDDKEARKRIRTATAKKRRAVLIAALLFNVGVLVRLKLLNYFQAFFTMFAAGKADAFSIIMPLGISYYTFSTVGYMLDVYWKRYESEKNFARFFLFAIYFPHIVQGPISRYNLLGRELKKEELRFRQDNLITGMESILLGCFKKLVIADRLGVFVSNTLGISGLSGTIYFTALLFDAFQIYADFSGYMDIVSGISAIFDVKLEKNFDHPFLAKSVPEFWRRWHMSLGSWFRDYVYYPINLSKPVKNIGKKVRGWENPYLKNLAIIAVPVFSTWVLTGLWHGTGPGYVLWGVYYGTLIALSTLFSEDIQKAVRKAGINTESRLYRLFQSAKMLLIFMGGRFLASTVSLSRHFEIIKSILTFKISTDFFSYGLNWLNFVIIFGGFVLFAAIALIERKEDIFTWFNRQNKIFCAIILYGLIFSVLLFGVFGARFNAEIFMYQQF